MAEDYAVQLREAHDRFLGSAAVQDQLRALFEAQVAMTEMLVRQGERIVHVHQLAGHLLEQREAAADVRDSQQAVYDQITEAQAVERKWAATVDKMLDALVQQVEEHQHG